jgi:large subunit ribosomal protein L1
MARVSKNTKEASALIDKATAYTLTDAAGLMKSISKTKFDASVDIAVKLGVDP